MEKALKQEHKLLLTKHEGLIMNYPTDDFQKDVLRTLITTPPAYHTDTPTLTSITSSALKVYRIGKQDWFKNAEGALIPIFESHQIVTPEMDEWYRLKLFFSRTYDKCCNSADMFSSIKYRNVSVEFIGNFVIVTNHLRQEKYLGSYTSWLAVRSLIDSHMSALYYSRIADLLKKFPGHSLYDDVSMFLKAGREDLQFYGNKYADIWKTIPALVIGDNTSTGYTALVILVILVKTIPALVIQH